MNILRDDRIVWCDVDDTLILWNLSAYPNGQKVTVDHVNGPVEVIAHENNIKTLIKFWKLGYTLIVHSGSGWRWAKAVVEALKLDQYVNTCMSKPMYYFDDKPVEEWAGPRIWRDPHTPYETDFRTIPTVITNEKRK